ncbi:hypothetical protein GCM10010104_71110 [Streptomyces indiaensis]|uniref:Uncharacterized protein n=1 Tax=Streptomyces indiaensis TaxID=284033 RepID=A0ABP5RJD8_9ACTN
MPPQQNVWLAPSLKAATNNANPLAGLSQNPPGQPPVTHPGRNPDTTLENQLTGLSVGGYSPKSAT